jgi:hypothetical protein
MMKNFQYGLSVLLLTLLGGCAAAPTSPAPEGLTQTGSWVVRENEVMRLAMGHAGKGTLIFQGWQYPFEFSDAKIGLTGTRSGDIEGEVYNLETLSDIEGTYYVNPELDAEKRVTGFWAHNDKGVTLHMRVQGENVDINLEAKGATVKLIEQ